MLLCGPAVHRPLGSSGNTRLPSPTQSCQRSRAEVKGSHSVEESVFILGQVFSLTSATGRCEVITEICPWQRTWSIVATSCTSVWSIHSQIKLLRCLEEYVNAVIQRWRHQQQECNEGVVHCAVMFTESRHSQSNTFRKRHYIFFCFWLPTSLSSCSATFDKWFSGISPEPPHISTHKMGFFKTA